MNRVLVQDHEQGLVRVNLGGTNMLNEILARLKIS